jgi:hypothetical protein
MNYLEMGGYLFTLPLTAIGIAVLALAGISAARIARGNTGQTKRQVGLVLHLGVFAFILGILAQTLGLFQAMNAIQHAGDISPALLAGGLRLSFITTIYGLLILTISFLAWMVLTWWSARAAE